MLHRTRARDTVRRGRYLLNIAFADESFGNARRLLRRLRRLSVSGCPNPDFGVSESCATGVGQTKPDTKCNERARRLRNAESVTKNSWISNARRDGIFVVTPKLLHQIHPHCLF